MRRHISIFAFLLSAFAAVGLTGSAAALEYYASSTHPFTITDCDGEDLKFDKYNEESGGYYHVFNDWDFGITALSMNSGDRIKAKFPDGYRFNGWYTKTGGWFNETEAYISEANERLTVEQAIDSVTIDKAGKWSNLPTIVAKYEIMLFDVTFKCNGGTPSSFESIKDQDITSTGILLPSVSRGGYDLEGWKNGKGKIFEAGSHAGSEFWNGTDRTFYSDLTAQWTGKTYSITLDRDGGTGGSCPGEYTVSESSQGLEITPPTKEGHTIQGWTVSGATGVTPTVAGSPLTLTIPANTYGNLTLTPTWRAATFTITYKPGSGTPGNEYADTKDWGKDMALRGKTYEDPKGQYVQDGWNTTKESFEGEPDYGLKAAYTDNASITLYPHWKLNGYKLTIHHKGAYYDGKLLEETALESLVVGTTNLNEILVAVPTNDAAFYGYYSTEGGSTQIYDEHGKCCNVEGVWSGAWPNGTFAGNANLEVWAKWGPPPEHCTIRAVCDPTVGGTVEPASTNVVKGRDVTLTATKNSGYSFCCWTNSNGAVVSEEPEYSFAVTADETYTAVFTGNVYKVSFVDDDESGSPPKSVYRQFGQPYGELPKSTYSNPTLLFSRWLDDDEKPVTAETIVSIAGNHVLHADTPFVKTNFDVIFIDKDGGNGAITNKDVATGTPVPPLAPTTWTRKYYTLVGWDPPLPQTVGASDLEFTAVWWSIGKDVLDCTNLDFEASGNWKPFADPDAVGGLCMRMNDCQGTDNLTAKLDKPGTLTFNWKSDGETKLRVKFGEGEQPLIFDGSGWKSKTFEVPSTAKFPLTLQFSCQKDEFQPGGFCAIDKVTWEPGVVTKYTLEVASAGDGTVAKSPDENDYEAGAQVTISATPDAGYAFEKWSDGSAENPRQITVMSNATYVATFTALPPDEYTVEVRSTGNGTVARDPDRAKYVKDVSVTISATPNAGYAFEKWSDGSVANPRQITVISNAVYSASFTNCVYEIMLNANGGTGGPTSVTVTYGEALPKLGSLPSREGYALTGYFDAVSGGVKYYNADGTGARNWDKTASAELYAQWENDVGGLSRILNCDNLRFESTVEGWEKCEDPEIYVAPDDPCLKSETKGAVITAKIKGKGTLTFQWSGRNFAKNNGTLLVKLGEVEQMRLFVADKATDAGAFREWTLSEPLLIDTQGEEMDLSFTCANVGTAKPDYLALDHVTWTPEGEHSEPVDGKDNVTISSATVSDGKFTLKFQSDARFDYNLLTNANLLINSWGIMETLPGDGDVLTFEPEIIEGQPQLFYKVETVQKK